MKKALLLASLALGTTAMAMAETPGVRTFSNVQLSKFSPDGKYIGSSVYEQLDIIDLANDTTYTYVDEFPAPTMGLGNAFSATGIMVGGIGDQIAAYWQAGQWKELTALKPEFSNMANGITPDGSRICGSIGNNAISADEDNIMLIPAIWDVKEDGTYGTPTVLPYPDKDLVGAVPQYVTALSISDDGNTIYGQVVDCRGTMVLPLIYTCDASGNWSYAYLHEELLNPDNITVPQNPGVFDKPWPDKEQYLSPEAKVEYEEAVAKYQETNEGDFPNVDDYLTAEELAQYEADYAVYEEEYDAWEVKFDAYDEAYQQLVNSSPQYVFNDGILVGKYLAVAGTKLVENPMSWSGYSGASVPYLFDLEAGTYEKYEGDFEQYKTGLCTTGLTADGVQLVSGGLYDCINAYVLKDGNIIGIYEWLQLEYPAYAEWLDKNSRYTYQTYDDDFEIVDIPDVLTIGLPSCTADLSLLGLSALNQWDFESYFESTLFDLKNYAGVESVTVDAAARTGIYDLSGRRVAQPTAAGFYIVNGKKAYIK